MIRRRKALKRRRATPRRSSRVIDVAHLSWVQDLGCLFEGMSYSCDGPIDPHHAGMGRGLGQKASDYTCIPLCRKHHGDVECLTGIARGWDRAIKRAFHAQAIEAVQELKSAIEGGSDMSVKDAKYGLTFAVEYLIDPVKAACAWYEKQ